MCLKVVILGAGGMLGHKIFQRCRVAFPGTIATMRARPAGTLLHKIDLLQGPDVWHGIDVADSTALSTKLAGLRPDVIVNCIGIVKQRVQAIDPIPSIAINSLLPHRLAALAAGWGGRLIHFSTDCVFSGNRGNYTEEDLSDAHDLYGRSKFLGETQAANALTLRTSIIGRELADHRSLLDWLRSQSGGKIRGYRQVIYSGVTTNHLADLVAEIIENHPALSGLYQVVSRPISKFDLLCLLRDAYSLDVEILPDELERSDRSMLGQKLLLAIGYTAPSWPQLVSQLTTDRTPYESWLSQ